MQQGNLRLEKSLGMGGDEMFNPHISTWSEFDTNSNICVYIGNLKTPETAMICKWDYWHFSCSELKEIKQKRTGEVQNPQVLHSIKCDNFVDQIFLHTVLSLLWFFNNS